MITDAFPEEKPMPGEKKITTKANRVVKRFETWKAKLIEDDNILGGEPVFPKSRLAVRQVGEMLLRGADPDEIKEAYPYLEDQDIEFAPLYTQAYPRVRNTSNGLES